MGNLNILPDDLPVPTDDGGCDHLEGMALPEVTLPSTSGRNINLATLCNTTVIYCYPMTGRPGINLPKGWDGIPGARGCTPQSCAFRDHYHELQGLGAVVYGISTQDTSYQKEVAARLLLPYELLSDANMLLVKALQLPTFEVDDRILIKRITLIVTEGVIKKVFYPVFPPDKNAEEVVFWLKSSHKNLLG